MTSHKKALDLVTSAFDDYVSGRFLLINKYSINGVILSSMAIEKYLKAILLRLKGSFKGVHLNQIDKLKEAFANTKYDVIFKYVDPQLFEILSLGYEFRYYDNIEKTKTISFATHQLLAEIDLFVAVLDELFQVNVNNESSGTSYQRAVLNKDKKVFENNYLLNNIDKKVFCEQETYIFVLHINPEKSGPILIEAHNAVQPYTGRLTMYKVTYDDAQNDTNL